MNDLSPSTFVPSEPDRLRARVSWLYHVEGHTQNEIATRMNLNRVMVVRLLAEARRRNEVRVSMAAPLSELIGLECRVEQKFAVRRVLLAPFADPDGDPTMVIAAAAGSLRSRRLRDARKKMRRRHGYAERGRHPKEVSAANAAAPKFIDGVILQFVAAAPNLFLLFV